MKKAAVVDVGSNSVRLLTCTYDANGIYQKEKKVITTRLGKDIEKNRTLNKDSILNTLEAFGDFRKIIDSKGIKDVYAMATSAVRDSLNKEELLLPAKDVLGVDVNVIAGDIEAYVGYLGVLSGLDSRNVTKVLIIDIGGGSTELILGDFNEIKYKKSIDLGAVRMTGLYVNSDPISNMDMKTLEKVVEDSVCQGYSDLRMDSDALVVGIGGTITTLGAIDMELGEYDPEKISDYELKILNLENILKKLKKRNNDSRKKIVGLSEKRSDIILAGSVILKKVLDFTGSQQVFLSDCDNLEGYLRYIVEKR